MNRRYLTLALCLLCCQVAPLHAQNPKDEARKDFDLASAESDSVKRVQLECKAAELDPKNLDYSRACNAERRDLIKSDARSLQRAQEAFDKNDYPKASTFAGYVVPSIDAKLSNQAKDLLEKIKAAQNGSPPAAAVAKKDTPSAAADQSAALYQQTKAAWEKGAFDEVRKSAQGITDPIAKDAANRFLRDVDRYNGYLAQAQKLEQTDPQAARGQYEMARELNPNGPGNPSAHMQSLEQTIAARQKAPPATPAQAFPANQTANLNKLPPKPLPPVDDSARFKVILADAQRAETEGKLQAALSEYDTLLRAQSGNPDALAGRSRVQQAISRDPAQLSKTLVEAIRDFYDSKFADAKVALGFYLDTPQARSRGAAYFYLGAALMEQSVLETPRSKKKKAGTTPPEALVAFQHAREAGYKPLARFVPPGVLKVWSSSGS